MLLELILKDYATFINETTFDFKATNSKILDSVNVASNRVLKGAFFIGENASGKTQVLEAIKLLLDLLFENNEVLAIKKKSLYTKGTKFSITYIFLVDNKRIKYFIEFDGNDINLEKLFIDEDLALERIKNNGRIYIKEQKDVEDIPLNLPLLKLEYYNTRFNNEPLLNKWFDFLKNSLYLNCLVRGGYIKSYNPSEISKQSLEKYAKDNDESKINKLLNKIGYNSEIVFKNVNSSIDNSIIIGSSEKIIGLKKKGTDVVIPLSFESTGNKIFTSSLLPFDYSVNTDCMLIIDEFSSGLHNELEEALIKYFFNHSKNSQIFVATHSTNILDTSILRPDQVYAFRFDSKEGTVINRFSNESPRESQNIEKMYLNGVFDGMPKYNKEFKD